MSTPDLFPPEAEIAATWCHGCNQERPINAIYLPYVPDGIQSCRHCQPRTTPPIQNPLL